MHMVFIDLEKAYDNMPQGIILESLKSFPFKLGLRQELTLSPFIFTVIMEEISKSIWETMLYCMLFANNIVLAPETKEEFNSKLEEDRAI